MRLVSFRRGDHASFGAVNGSGVVDLGTRLRVPSLTAALQRFGYQGLRGPAFGATPDFALGEVELLAVLPDAPRIFCIGINYVAHRKETGRAAVDHPTVFVRFAPSVVGHGQAMVKPPESEQYDYEGELAVVIGRAGRRIPAAAALAHVAGYSCFNDGSLRDFQYQTSQFTPGKNFDASGAFGPWLVTADEIPDPQKLALETRLNGEVMQSASTDLMIFSVAQQIAYISTFTELHPGDVIATGTPGGVGSKREPPVFMTPGDKVEVEIERVGLLSNPIGTEA
jgi:2-keto-4-pentenoate hydratase/2-oxohepta-3-ene-1,7-dioic acid hydratase in catechol pathway